jgi:hypothetical protein
MASAAAEATRQPFAIAQAGADQSAAERVISDAAAADEEELAQTTLQFAACMTSMAPIPNSAAANKTPSFHDVKCSADLLAVSMTADI